MVPCMAQPDEIRWLLGKGIPRQFYWLLGCIVVFVGFLDAIVGFGRGWVVLARALELDPANGGGILSAAVYIISIGGPLAVVFGALVTVPTRLGVGPKGLRVVTRFGTRDVPWSRLRAGRGTPTTEWAVVQEIPTSPGKLGRAIYVTKEQALTILATPGAPASLFSPECRAWLGSSPEQER